MFVAPGLGRSGRPQGNRSKSSQYSQGSGSQQLSLSGQQNSLESKGMSCVQVPTRPGTRNEVEDIAGRRLLFENDEVSQEQE